MEGKLLWLWEEARTEAQCSKIYQGRMDIGAVKNSLRSLIGQGVRCILVLEGIEGVDHLVRPHLGNEVRRPVVLLRHHFLLHLDHRCSLCTRCRGTHYLMYPST